MGTKANMWARVSPKAEEKDTRARLISHPKASISSKALYITPKAAS